MHNAVQAICCTSGLSVMPSKDTPKYKRYWSYEICRFKSTVRLSMRVYSYKGYFINERHFKIPSAELKYFKNNLRRMFIQNVDKTSNTKNLYNL